ncbi:acyltransferase [Paenibacillus sp. CC-CFT747]|nr:acyltransferase [Paenibacillus sp. CC-CFT747]
MDGFRFLLALWVAVGHFYIIIGGPGFWQASGVTKLLLSPWAAVDGFMVVTGFLMTYHYLLREAKEPAGRLATGVTFLVRRLFRLYPVYLLAILAAFFVVSDLYEMRKEILDYFTGSTLTPFGTESKSEDPSVTGLLLHLTFLHGLFPAYESSVLSVAWSLSLEMQFYVLFPALFSFLFLKVRSAKLYAFLAAAVVVSEVLLAKYLHGQPAMLLYKLPCFSSACLPQRPGWDGSAGLLLPWGR